MIKLDHKINNAPGLLLSIKQRNHSITHIVSGLADVQKNISMQPDRLFRCGLITRLFTSALLLRLVDKNAFDLDEPLEILARHHQQDHGLLNILVNQYPLLKPITVRELLNNTSGLPAFDKTIAYNEIFVKKPRKIWQIENYLDVISGVGVRYQHGYDSGVRGYFKDSSTNYVIATLVIEAVSGVKASDMMRDLFWEFNLNDTHYMPYGVMDKKLLPRMIHGYLPISHPYAVGFADCPDVTYNDSKELRAYDVTMGYTINGMGNAAAVSTSSDLIRWIGKWMECKVVVNNYKQLFVGVPINRRSSTEVDFYCLGFYKSITKKLGEVIWTAGNSLGYSTLLAHLLDKDITFVLMANISRQHFGLHSEGLIADTLNKIIKL